MAGKVIKKSGWQRRKERVRKKIHGTAERPRLSVFRSNKHTYAQLVDDVASTTLASVSTENKALKVDAKANKTDKAKQAGVLVAELASKSGITSVVFDRNGYLYHGRVKALAEGAREGGLKF
jgi:large subunit ribosomal protein L18